jgi:DNA-binding PadR family transcriptional regulator
MLVLSALRRGDAHGFEILKRLEQAGSGALKLKEGSLYPALYRMEAAGLIKGAWETEQAPRRGPRRRIYRLTAKGRRQLDQARSDFHNFVQVVGQILGAKA